MIKQKFQIGKFYIHVNWLIALSILITALTFLNLGIWQLGRAAEKVEAQEALELELRQMLDRSRLFPKVTFTEQIPRCKIGMFYLMVNTSMRKPS